MKKTLILILTCCSSFTLISQQNNANDDNSGYQLWYDMMQNPEINFFEVQKAFYDYWERHEYTRGAAYKVFKRWEYFMSSRIYPNGDRISPKHIWDQYQSYLQNHEAQRLAGGDCIWAELGPVALPNNGTGQPNGLGRINSLAFHPDDPNVIFVGAPAGGLWKTTDGGATWQSNTDQLPTLGVSAIVIDSFNANIMYMGTGDRDAGNAPGMGVMKSIDGGETWSFSNNGMGNRTVGKMLIHPGNSNILLAATTNGIYRSTDAGTNWTLEESGNFKDLVFKPGNPDIVYATGSSSIGFYRSTDNGASWTNITSGLSSESRMVIGVSAANPDYVYLLATGGTVFSALYRSTNSGLSFSVRSTTPNILGYEYDGSDTKGQGYYDLCMAIDPLNANTVYAGGINIFKSVDGGATWTINAHWVGTGAPDMHADQHALEFSPVNGRLYACNDGGIYWTSNGGTAWNDISSGLAIAQVYKIGQSATQRDLVINGYQDNGTAIFNNGNWATEIGGDGMECIVDYTTTTYLYGALYYGDIRRSSSGGSSFSPIAADGTNGIDETGDWVTPYILHATDPNTMFIGYDNVWRSNNIKTASSSNVTWTKISNGLGANSFNLKVIEQSPADVDILYVSKSDELYRCDNANSGSPTWTDISSFVPSFYLITDVEAHPTDDNTVYMCSGFDVYKSVNKGTSWTDISGTLPDVPVNAIVYDEDVNEGLYIATDIGVFFKNGTVGDWTLLDGLPTVEVTELEIYYAVGSNKRLRASTYGRGLWETPTVCCSVDVDCNDGNACTMDVCDNGVCYFSALDATFNPICLAGDSAHFYIEVNINSLGPASSYDIINNGGASSITGIITEGLYQIGPFPNSIVVNVTVYDNSDATCNVTASGLTGNCSSVISSFPSCQSFQSFSLCSTGCSDSCLLMDQWNNDLTDDSDWKVNAGATSSFGTGPSTDHTIGSVSGNYIYTEASTPCFPYKKAVMTSPAYDLSSLTQPALEFWYHMYGTDMGTLVIEIESPAGSASLDTLAVLAGDHGDLWQPVSINLAAYAGDLIKFRFVSITGPDFTSDIALDDICVKELPACIEPTNLQVENLTISTADLKWISSNPGSAYFLEWGATGFIPGGFGSIGTESGTSVAGWNTVSLSALFYNTGYQFYVNEICSPGDTTALVGPYPFITPSICNPPSVVFNPECIPGDTSNFNVEVNIYALGSASSYDITNNAGAAVISGITTTGAYQVGPFPTSAPVTVTVVDNDTAACNISSGTLFPNCGNSFINDYCSGAIQLNCDSAYVFNSIESATMDSNALDVGFCGTTVDGPGIWYKVVGTGDSVSLSTCNSLSDYDTKLNVFAGTCNNLLCVAGNDDAFPPCAFIGLASHVSFESVTGTEYFILVSGYAGSVGNFALTMNCIPDCIPSFTFKDTSICDGDSIFLGGNLQNQSGTYADTLVAFDGCDSICITTLTVRPNVVVNLDTMICEGDTVFLGGGYQTVPGVYTDTFVAANGCDSISLITLLTDECAQEIVLQLKAYLGGAYNISDGLLTDFLRTNGYIPLADPYDTIFTHYLPGGGETIDTSVLLVSGSNAIADWIFIELRDKTDSTVIVATRSALIQRDGDIVDIDGVSALSFAGMLHDDYYVVVRHRNHLGVMTGAPVALSSTPTFVDFTSLATDIYGINAQMTINSVLALWSGEVVGDGVVKYSGAGNDRDAILVRIGGMVPTDVAFGYYHEDVSMNGVTQYSGAGNDRDIILVNIGGAVPTDVVLEQLP